MRTALLVAALLAAPAAAVAADPPVVFQTQPPGRLLDDFRATIQALAGDGEVKDFDKWIKESLGDKGFDGLDLSRPAGGYVAVPADPKQSVAVLALPVTSEEGFVGFFERMARTKPKPGEGGVYAVTPPGEGVGIAFRVADGYAYVAAAAEGVDLAKAVGADLVPFARFYDPAEPALVAARVYFDRFPKEVRDKALAGLDEAKEALAGAKLPPEVGDPAKAAFDQLVKLSTRYIDLSKGAKEAGLRLNLDPAAGAVQAELTLTAAEGSPLAKDIAGRKPTTNAFAGLLTPDVVAGFRFRLPLFTEEIRNSAVIGLEALRKEAANANFLFPPPARPLLNEFFDGAVRTAKTGEADVAGVIRGPSPDGFYTAVGAAVFDDPSGVEKELKKLIVGMAPPEFTDLIKWDADKAGGVGIHTFDFGKWNEEPGRDLRPVFGPDAVAAVAFAPKAVVLAVGPDAVAAVKKVLGLKPAEAPVAGVVVNPAKVARMAGAVEEQAAGETAKVWGKDDKPLSVLSLGVAGGTELKVTLGLNLRLFAGVLGWRAASGAADAVPDKE
ncbi:MAG: hypothetical protein K2X87_31600 [Gemmataceae bacterium]|nr:hypothetical protein [Gemmataceae bacterium]